MRSERVLQLWAEADPGKPVPGVPVKQEIALLKKALLDQDDELFAGYGGEQGVVDRYLELQKLPEAGLAEGVKIDDYSTYRATRFAEAGMKGRIGGDFHVYGGPHAFGVRSHKGGVSP